MDDLMDGVRTGNTFFPCTPSVHKHTMQHGWMDGWIFWEEVFPVHMGIGISLG
jgi:hypothetical protein